MKPLKHATHRHTHARRRRLSIALAMLMALPTLAAPAAQAKTNHHYTSVIRSGPLSTAHGYPAPGGTAVSVGTWVTKQYGNGALVDHVRITGHPTPATFTFKGREIDFVALGSFKATTTGTATVQSDGSLAIVVKGRFTGGTGAYRGAKGSFKFTGSMASGSTVGRSAGTISY